MDRKRIIPYISCVLCHAFISHFFLKTAIDDFIRKKKVCVHIYVCIHTHTHTQASLVAQMVKNLPAMWETQVWSLGWEDPPEEGMATHSSILAWRIPRREEPGGLSIVHGVAKRHDRTTKHGIAHYTCTHLYINYTNYLHIYVKVGRYNKVERKDHGNDFKTFKTSYRKKNKTSYSHYKWALRIVLSLQIIQGKGRKRSSDAQSCIKSEFPKGAVLSSFHIPS